jgi:mRNA interferase RelE/StbE
MNVEFTTKFKKQYDQLNRQPDVSASLLKIIDMMQQASSISEIKNSKKLAGYTKCYRIRVGNYRIGLKIEEDTVIFAAFAHRNDICKQFP